MFIAGIMGLSVALKDQLTKKFADRVRFDEPMTAHTTFRVGGPADAFVTVTDEKEITFLVRWLRQNELPFLIVGAGTNLLVRDGGIRGVVIAMTRSLAKISQPDAVTVSAMGGAGLNAVCRFAIRKGLAGLNFALGIPGTVGGAIRGNAGAWERDMEKVVHSLRIISPDGTVALVDKTQLAFSYRALSLVDQCRDLSASIILEARFSVSQQGPEILKAEADRLLSARKKTQPVGTFSAGCFFKNPENCEPAGKLIDLAGGKDLRSGDAAVSSKHANFIVNQGRASAEDILRLMNRIQEAVLKKFNILLEPEVKIVGEKSA